MHQVSVRWALISAKSVTNKTFILNEFFTPRELNFYVHDGDVASGWRLHAILSTSSCWVADPLVLRELQVDVEELLWFSHHTSHVGSCQFFKVQLMEMKCQSPVLCVLY